MKKKNVIVIIGSVIVFVVSVALLYRYLFPPSPDSQIKVVIPHPVDPNFNQEQLNVLKDDVVDFSQDINPSEQTQPAQPSRENQTQQNSTQPVGQSSRAPQSIER